MVRKIGAILGDIGKKLTAGSSWHGRIGRGLSYFAAGQGASAIITHKADEVRNYYGDKSYDSQFGSGAETLAGTASAIGTYYGVFALAGRDPMARIKNTFKLSSAKHQNRIHAKVSGRLNARASNILGREDHHTLLYTGPQRAFRFKRKPTEILTRGRHVNEDSMNRRINKYKLHSPDDIKKLADTPRADPLRLMMWASWTGLLPGATQGTTSWIGETIGATAGVGASVVGGFAAGYAITKMGASKSLIGTAVMGGAGYMGYRTATRDNNAAAEGTISSFDRYNDTGVSRMNFSTAGLVQALHNKNRRY